jgi:hypothetical protein
VALFAVIRERGPAWDRSRDLEGQAGWNDHAEFMDGLADEGFVLVGGPLGDGTDTLLIVEAEGEAAIRERLAADPWGTEMLRIGLIEPWQIRLGRL